MDLVSLHNQLLKINVLLNKSGEIMRNFISILGLFLFLSVAVQAKIIETIWTGGSDLKLNDHAFCSHDKSKPADFYENSGWLRIDKWNNGWFRIESNGHCGVGWFGNRSYVFQQVGNDVMDKFGVKVGTANENSIVLNSGADWDNDSKIQRMTFNTLSDGNLEINVKFTDSHSNQIFHKPVVFELSGKFHPYTE